MTVRGRYAPSPTGTIHLGNASTALLAWLSVRARGGVYVMSGLVSARRTTISGNHASTSADDVFGPLDFGG